MAETKVNKGELAYPTVTVDGNGWTCYNYGTHRVFNKMGEITESWSGGQWKAIVLSSNMPVGFSSYGQAAWDAVQITCQQQDNAITSQAGYHQAGDTGFIAATTNMYGGAVNGVKTRWTITLTKNGGG